MGASSVTSTRQQRPTHDIAAQTSTSASQLSKTKLSAILAKQTQKVGANTGVLAPRSCLEHKARAQKSNLQSQFWYYSWRADHQRDLWPRGPPPDSCTFCLYLPPGTLWTLASKQSQTSRFSLAPSLYHADQMCIWKTEPFQVSHILQHTLAEILWMKSFFPPQVLPN
jgi:hypothetical protein